MIIGAHSIIYSSDADADRAFLRDVLRFPHVDVGEGWLIFGLPPSEVAIHPGTEDDGHEFYLMCDDIQAFVREMRARKRDCSPVQQMGWGALALVTLPGGGKLGVYEPRHARPASMSEPARAEGRASKTGASSKPSKASSTAKTGTAKTAPSGARKAVRAQKATRAKNAAAKPARAKKLARPRRRG